MIPMTREEELQALVSEGIAEGRDFEAESLAVIDEIEEGQREDRARSLSIKERLKRRLISGYIDVPFNDDLGEFNIKLRLPSPAQRKRFIELTIETEKAIEGNDEDELVALDGEMCEIIGSLCMDFDADYIKSGEGFGVDIIQKLMQVIVGFEPVKMEEYRFFRSPP